jgi:hypothetical protein
MADSRSNQGFGPLSRALTAEGRRLKLDRGVREAAALTLWPEVVGEQIAGATQAERVRDGVLYVIARNSTWAFELTFHREQIRKGLNARLGGETIQEIRFRSGTVRAPESPPPAPEPTPTAAELAAVALSAQEAEAIEREVERVADPELQGVVRRLLTNERRRVAWQREHGLRECAGCGTLHSTAGDRCPACRSEAR